LCASLTGLCLLTPADRAGAAEARRKFAIPPKPYSEALVDLAVQANVSLLGTSACGPDGRASLSGRYTLSQALARLLAGAPCAWRIVDARTVRISPVSPQPRIEGPSLPSVSELLVTARKRPERLDVLPAGVSAVSGEQLLASGAYDVRDTAGQLVGVLTTNLGPGRDKLLMRGLSDGAFTGRARSTVSTYLDDAPINYNAPDPDLRLTDVERVETLRGPQGALYGSGALAGVYRIVANKPDTEHFAGGISGIAANTQGGSPSYVAEGYANAPFMEGRAALRVVGYYDEQGGYLDNPGLRLSNVDSTTRQGGRAAMRVALGDRWTLDVSAVAQRLHSNDTQYVTQATPTSPQVSTRTNQVRESSINDFAQGAITLRGEFAGADIAATTSYVQHDFSNLYDATAVTTAPPISSIGASLGVYSEAARIRRVVQDITITSVGSGPISWLAGAYGSTSVERTPSALDILISTASVAPTSRAPPLTRVYEEERRDHLDEIAAYGEGSWRLAPGWTVSAGVRAFQSALHVKSNISGAFPTVPRFVHEVSRFSGLSPKISVQYEFGGGELVYGLYSEGFRPGGVNSTNFFIVDLSRTTFRPDRLQNFEVGAKGRFADNRLVVRAAAFYDVWTDIQSDQYRQNGLAFTANVGNARIEGVEAEASYEWMTGLTLQANALYADAAITSVRPEFAGSNRDLAPQLLSTGGLPGAPRWSSGLLARYDRPLPHDLLLRLVARGAYVGSTRLAFDPSLSARTDPVWDIGLTADVVQRHWSAGLYVINPGDSSGNTFAYGNPFSFSFGGVRQVTPQRPRTVGIRLTANY
jgi:outer membrane receptor protein involved in Fe transport